MSTNFAPISDHSLGEVKEEANNWVWQGFSACFYFLASYYFYWMLLYSVIDSVKFVYSFIHDWLIAHNKTVTQWPTDWVRDCFLFPFPFLFRFFPNFLTWMAVTRLCVVNNKNVIKKLLIITGLSISYLLSSLDKGLKFPRRFLHYVMAGCKRTLLKLFQRDSWGGSTESYGESWHHIYFVRRSCT